MSMVFVSGLSDLNADKVDSVLTVTCEYSRAVRFIPLRMRKNLSNAYQVARHFRERWWVSTNAREQAGQRRQEGVSRSASTHLVTSIMFAVHTIL